MTRLDRQAALRTAIQRGEKVRHWDDALEAVGATAETITHRQWEFVAPALQPWHFARAVAELRHRPEFADLQMPTPVYDPVRRTLVGRGTGRGEVFACFEEALLLMGTDLLHITDEEWVCILPALRPAEAERAWRELRAARDVHVER